MDCCVNCVVKAWKMPFFITLLAPRDKMIEVLREPNFKFLKGLVTKETVKNCKKFSGEKETVQSQQTLNNKDQQRVM